MNHAVALLKELLLTGAVTVVTTQRGVALVEGAPLDAVSVIQLDGDVVNYLREGAELGRHFAALRRTKATLSLLRRCFTTAERGVFWGAALAAQGVASGWAVDIVLQHGVSALFGALGEPAHLVSTMFGLLVPAGLYAARQVVREALLRALSGGAVEVFSARPR